MLWNGNEVNKLLGTDHESPETNHGCNSRRRTSHDMEWNTECSFDGEEMCTEESRNQAWVNKQGGKTPPHASRGAISSSFNVCWGQFKWRRHTWLQYRNGTIAREQKRVLANGCAIDFEQRERNASCYHRIGLCADLLGERGYTLSPPRVWTASMEAPRSNHLSRKGQIHRHRQCPSGAPMMQPSTLAESIPCVGLQITAELKSIKWHYHQASNQNRMEVRRNSANGSKTTHKTPDWSSTEQPDFLPSLEVSDSPHLRMNRLHRTYKYPFQLVSTHFYSLFGVVLQQWISLSYFKVLRNRSDYAHTRLPQYMHSASYQLWVTTSSRKQHVEIPRCSDLGTKHFYTLPQSPRENLMMSRQKTFLYMIRRIMNMNVPRGDHLWARNVCKLCAHKLYEALKYNESLFMFYFYNWCPYHGQLCLL